jgi:trehalose 6-phosphate phosphatase
MTEAQEKLDDFFRAFTGGTRPVLLLDYDGTLAPFRVDRFKARPWAGVRKLLTRIQNQGLTRVEVVTGRPAAEVAPLLGLAPAPGVWGLHGAERLHADGRRDLEIMPPETHAKLQALCAKLRDNPLGGLVEEKPNAVAIHWRGVPRARAAAIEKRTRALFEPLAQMNGLSLLEFEAGLELRVGRDKGEVVKMLLEETGGYGPGPIAYLGDDFTDEAAFRAIKGHGLGVLVRRQWRATDADVWLRPPGELKAFLKRWSRACRSLSRHRIAA